MKTSNSKTWLVAAHDDRASEIAEMAVVLPLLFAVLMAIFWFGQAFRIYGTLAHAAREGARVAVAPVCATCTASASGPGQLAQNAVLSDLAAAHMATGPNQLLPTTQWTPPTLCQCHSSTAAGCTPVTTCDQSATQVCVQENVQLSYPTTTQNENGMGTCGTSVSMRYMYPFHFNIPMTNLDLGNIQIPGQAEMRVETQ